MLARVGEGREVCRVKKLHKGDIIEEGVWISLKKNSFYPLVQRLGLHP